MEDFTDTKIVTRRSARIAKRLKLTPIRSSENGGTGSSNTTGSIILATEATISSLLLSFDDDLLHTIFSYVGKDQYRWVGGVNRIFQKSYLSLYPEKRTKLNSSTTKLSVFCWNDVATCRRMSKYHKDDVQHALWNYAAKRGNIDTVKALLRLIPKPLVEAVPEQNRSYSRDCNDWKYDLCYKAAEYGQKELLQWACTENICVWKNDLRVCRYAIGSGNMDIYHWAVENGFEWDIDSESQMESAAVVAAEKGQLEALQWIAENGPSDTIGYLSSTEYCDAAAKGGHLEVLQWLRSMDCGWGDFTFLRAIEGDHVNVVQYMFDNGFENTATATDACSVAARCGNMATLQLLHSLNFHWDEYVTAAAAESGRCDVIQWLRDHGCPWSKTSCQYAAANGQFHTLKWLHANGCPWDERTTAYALNDEICVWATQNGCPVTLGNPRFRRALPRTYSGEFRFPPMW